MERKEGSTSYLDEYAIIKHLGAGYQAQVKLGADQHGKLVAIKIYKPLTSTIDTLQQELKVMQQMHHQNLIQLISVRDNAVIRSENGTIDKCFAIVLEYAGGGELFDYIAETGRFSEKVARTYFHQMMNGVHYMHEKGYAHRDIKPENLLLSDTFVLKIADFGFSCLLKGKDGTGVLHTRLGTEGYMAPEIVSHEYNGRKVDIFACGVILFIMYSGNPPFEKASPNDPYFKLLMDHREKYFWQGHSRHRPEGFFSDSFRNLFEKLVAVDPKERLNIYEIAKHPWVKASICTHTEIIAEFADRKKRMEKAIEERRIDQQNQRLKRMEAVKKTVSYTFSEEEIISQNESEKEREGDNFVQTYNREKLNSRIIQTVEEAGCEDVVVKNVELEYVVSSLKEFLRTHELLLVDSELLEEEVDKLKVVQLMDSLRQIEVTYTYHLQQQQFVTSKVVVLIRIGRLSPNELCIHFQRMEGDKLYFKRIVKELKHGCFA